MGSGQEAGDPPEALARIPTLTLEDLPRSNKAIPIAREELAGVPLYTHALPTNGVVYLDLGVNLDRLLRPKVALKDAVVVL